MKEFNAKRYRMYVRPPHVSPTVGLPLAIRQARSEDRCLLVRLYRSRVMDRVFWVLTVLAGLDFAASILRSLAGGAR